MPKLADTKEEFIAEFIGLATRMWDAAYANGGRDTLNQILANVGKAAPQPPASKLLLVGESPQKRGARNRAAHGAIKAAVRDAIYAHPDDGMSRPAIVEYAADRGVVIKPGSLKQAIRILKSEKQIINRDRKWFPAQATGLGKPGAGAPGLFNDEN